MAFVVCATRPLVIEIILEDISEAGFEREGYALRLGSPRFACRERQVRGGSAGAMVKLDRIKV